MHQPTHRQLRRTVIDTMRSHKLVRMTAHYHGYGDEGRVNELQFTAADGTAITDYDLENPVVAAAFWDAVEPYVDSALDQFDLTGYENNDGGEGQVVLDVSNGKELVRHSWMELVAQPEIGRGFSMRPVNNRRRRLPHGRQRR